MKNVAVLFVAPQSYYRGLANCECYGVERDARTFPGHRPVVAHPPCAQWGKLRHFANEDAEQKALAHFAVEQVRRWGGVLEHPAGSLLWDAAGLPAPAGIYKHGTTCAGPIKRDHWGGWTLAVAQLWWGHLAEKKTWLYIVGCDPENIPQIPPFVGAASHVVSSSRAENGLTVMKKAERQLTPPAFAIWLLDLASKCVAPASVPTISGRRSVQLGERQ